MDRAAELRETGVVVLRDVFATDGLRALREAAARCFEAIEAGDYPVHRYSHSVLLGALTDFGCGPEDLLAPLNAPGMTDLFSAAPGGAWSCKMEQSWARKKFAPRNAPSREYFPQNWHQDGALGVQFPLEPGPAIPMTELVTCWIPLDPCGADSPGLEFVRGRQDSLLHFTELDDAGLRRRFPAETFWAPELEFGEGLVFLNSVLHRTHSRPEMARDRMSVEYRIFPR